MTALALAVAVALAGLTLACGWTARLDAWCRDQRRASRARLALAIAADRAESDAADADAAEDHALDGRPEVAFELRQLDAGTTQREGAPPPQRLAPRG